LIVFASFSFLRRAEAPEAFSVRDLVGQRGRVSVSIRAGRAGSVLLSYAGSTHELTATADSDIPAGRVVIVTEVAGPMIVVAPAVTAALPGGPPDA
jgi:membrane protein implicated in regulation of membrane protease activity